ncbi:methionine--tRNA ligase [Candidatus Nesciobacter abundans]|uniref:Methionine--tRNA ligase n=1 Tax=Candidatus Nesciobacter abundans TaxID=2601668 RepID=A0A5C0UGL5_9PROT|nr:methionine--tRNA ligase [Candidatus Nesciobacter abundans]QEK39218.1 methionine--tRNA ligase [Candidatus Nesciobacter abundans]
MVQKRGDVIKTSYRNYAANFEKLLSGKIKNSVKKRFITTPIYYVNGNPHIGHLYTSVACDVLSRFYKLFSKVAFSSGTDEHGQKVEREALKRNLEPQKYVDEMQSKFLDLLDRSNVKVDCFVRTTSKDHKENVLKFWNKLVDSGNIYKGSYSGWYSTVDESYYSESEIKDGKSIETGSDVEWLEEEVYFFKLSEWKEKLLEIYSDSNMIFPEERRKEVLGMINSDLPDLCVSRSNFSWGIKLDDQNVVYVWVDALVNYITALDRINSKQDTDCFSIENAIHIIGKDILKFHAIYWPAMLLACKVPLPSKIYAHGWWTVDGQKMSKSLGNVVDPFDLMSKYGADEVRYFLLKEMNFGNDGDFSYKKLEDRINLDLANSIGNLVQRILKFTEKEYGRVPKLDFIDDDKDMAILQEWDKALIKSIEFMDNQSLHSYLDSFISAVFETNKYLEDQSPWKKSADRKRKILSVGCECLKRMSILGAPIMPEKMIEIVKAINIMDHEELEEQPVSDIDISSHLNSYVSNLNNWTFPLNENYLNKDKIFPIFSKH